MSKLVNSTLKAINNNSLLGFKTMKGDKGIVLSDPFHNRYIPATIGKAGNLLLSPATYSSKREWINDANQENYIGVVQTIHLFENHTDMYRWLIGEE